MLILMAKKIFLQFYAKKMLLPFGSFFFAIKLVALVCFYGFPIYILKPRLRPN